MGPRIIKTMESPALLTEAQAVNNRITKLGARIAMIAICTSNASIFLPRYSGVLPTISPAINTVRIINITIP